MNMMKKLIKYVNEKNSVIHSQNKYTISMKQTNKKKNVIKLLGQRKYNRKNYTE